MPLSEKVRIATYIPDLPNETYQNLLQVIAREFTYAFGGCTIMRSLDGMYLSECGDVVSDYVNVIYTDTPLSLRENGEVIGTYTGELRESVFSALEEETILVTVESVFHAE